MYTVTFGHFCSHSEYLAAVVSLLRARALPRCASRAARTDNTVPTRAQAAHHCTTTRGAKNKKGARQKTKACGQPSSPRVPPSHPSHDARSRHTAPHLLKVCALVAVATAGQHGQKANAVCKNCFLLITPRGMAGLVLQRCASMCRRVSLCSAAKVFQSHERHAVSNAFFIEKATFRARTTGSTMCGA